MKKLTIALLLAAGCLLMSAPVGAARAFDLSGNSYNVFILCSDDVGDFCDNGKTINDKFIFDGNSFAINSFEEEWGGLADNGNFSSGGLTFDASYTAIKGLAEYEFTIKGLSLVDIILLGKMDIKYSEIIIWPPDKIDASGSALFIGIKN